MGVTNAPGCDVRRGSVYLPASLAEAHFSSIGAVVLMIDGSDLLVLPVARSESGGCLLKRRNAAGDRVATAPDLFAAHGLDALSAKNLPAAWSDERGALRVSLPQTWFTQ